MKQKTSLLHPSEQRGVEAVTPKDALHAVLHTLEGPDPGRRFPCADDTTTIGRQSDCTVCLESPAVSRHHARIVLPCEGDQYAVRAQRVRHHRTSGLGGSVGEEPKPGSDFPFSRSLVRHALAEGVGLLSEDVGDDLKLPKTATLIALNLRSF